MGAETFMTSAHGKTARRAFDAAVEQALHDYGHSGYTGTIAEKTDYVEIPLPDGKNFIEYANMLLETDDDRIADKWGPAGCIEVKPGKYLFFGWASS